MPRRDASGPQGMGPLTGRGMGQCQVEARLASGYGRGFGRGNGRGLNRRNGAGFRNYQPSQDDLKLEKQDLERRLNEINNTLKQ